MMEKPLQTPSQFDWSKYRNKWVWFGIKKMKLRNYIKINASIMTRCNKQEWKGKNHEMNYRKCLFIYGLPGLKHYENRFYKNTPMPDGRSKWNEFKFWVKTIINQLKNSL